MFGDDCPKMFDDFINAYISDAGEMTNYEAFELAKARDEEANINFLASVFDQ